MKGAPVARRDGRQLAAPGRTGLARPGFFDPVPEVEDLEGSDPVSARRWATQLARALSGHHRVMPCRVKDSTGIKFLGDGALSADCFAIACRVRNGRPESTVWKADANRCPAGECMHSPRGAQGSSDHGYCHLRHPCGGVHPQTGRPLPWFASKPLPRSGQPRPAGPAGPNPRRRHRHRDRRWGLRHPSLP